MVPAGPPRIPSPTKASPMAPVSEMRLLSAVGGRCALLAVVLLVGGLAAPPLLRAQTPAGDSLSLAERYRTVRLRLLAQDYIDGRRTLPIRPPRLLPVPVDSLLRGTVRPDTARTAAAPRPAFPIASVRRVRDLERSWFRDRYRGVEWSFLGSGTRLTFFDTTRTRDLRARLQAHFGEPTRTLAEMYSTEWARAPDSTREAPIQFEYWFVVNDSIPVRVSDVNGPDERGVIVSTDRRYREDLVALRATLLRPLRTAARAPYADYYYEEATRRWYRVGYDGRTFFRERISRLDIVPGRRPPVDTVRTESSAAVPASSTSPEP